jgi:phosphotransferase system HPr (HPr) family protein
MIKEIVEIKNKTGLHARPAAKFIQMANKFKSNIMIQKDEKTANAKSIMSVLGLGASQGSQVVITADGDDEWQAVNELIILLSQVQISV